MENSDLYQLLESFIKQEISAKQRDKLRSLISVADDRELDAALFQIWEQYEAPEKCNHTAFEETLKIFDSSIRPKPRIHWLSIVKLTAAAILLIAISSVTVYNITKQQTTKLYASREYQIVTEKGQRASLILPDSTKVTINANSSLSYSATFGKENRNILLSGEGYFDVTKNKELPFIVKTAETSVKVTGTKFNISAYPMAEWFETTLIEGSVEVFVNNSPSRKVRLKENEKARYNTLTGQLLTIKSDSKVETAWKKGDLVFISQPLEEIFTSIENYYGVSIHISGKIPNKLFSASYHENDASQVLNNLRLHYGFSMNKQNNQVYITFK